MDMIGLIGNRIFHYEILEKLGEGGMGIVYKAEDTKLHRKVAIKLLRPEAIGDHAAKKRFIREARAASALNHPYITIIYEINEWHDRDFICMEYVEGKTLKAIIKNEKLAIVQVIDYAIQIAQGLNEAHEHDIIHRDIKSENIMITPKGCVKVMDFGLAKITGTKTKSTIGVTMGTIAYMSPEQTRGETVDFRTDIWSFGVVLYEMITGELPFKGGYEQAVIYSILNQNPEPVEKLRPDIPPELLHIVNRTLEKKPDNRYGSTDELLTELKKTSKDPFREINTLKSSKKIKLLKKKSRLVLPFLVALTLMIITFAMFNNRSSSIKNAPQVQTIPLTNTPGSEIEPDFSPHGNQVAFAWDGISKENYDIYIKAIDGDYPYQVTTHPGNDHCPTWSPNGNHIAFIRQTENQTSLHKIEILGGIEQKLASLDIELSGGDYTISADWSPDGALIAYSDRNMLESPICLYTLSLDDMKKQKITSPPPEVLGDVCPRYSPDRKYLAFVRISSFMASELYLLHLDSGDLKRLTFDDNYIISADWTSDGRELVFSSKRGVQVGLWIIPIDGGKPQPVVFGGQGPTNLSVAAQGDILACQNINLNTNIWRNRISTRKSEIFSISNASDTAPQYAPNGEKIAFASSRSGDYEIWTCDSSGTNVRRLTRTEGTVTGHPWWSPDGKKICFDSRPRGQTDIYIMDVETRSIEQMTRQGFIDRRPTWSKTGRSIYFSSNRSGRFEMWQIDLASKDLERITENGGDFGVDSFDGRWLYFNKGPDIEGIWKIPVDGGMETLVLDIETGWFKWHLVHDGIYYLRQDSTDTCWLEFYDFASGAITPIRSITHNKIWTMTISPDQKNLLTVPWQSESDIILVKNFR